MAGKWMERHYYSLVSEYENEQRKVTMTIAELFVQEMEIMRKRLMQVIENSG